MKDIKSQFRALVSELDQNPNVVLLDYQEYLPATDQEIETVEAELEFLLPSSIKHFYQTTNGLRLSWIHKEDEFYDADQHAAMTLPADLNLLVSDQFPDYKCDSKHESASISIKSLADVFLEEFHMNPYLKEEACYVFDAFSVIHGAAISFPKSKQSPVVSFNADHYTYFDNYQNSMSFAEYLDYLILIKGVKGLRYRPQDAKLLDPNLGSWPSEFYYCEY